MDELIITNRPKFIQNITPSVLNNLQFYRGTAFRGVSRNGKDSW